MAHEIKGDLEVCRTGNFGRRANQGLIQPADLTAARTLVKDSHWWQRLQTNNLGVQDVQLPDATTLPEGWSVTIENYGSVDAIDVVDDGAGAVKTIATGIACRFTLVDNSTAAGTWFVHCLNEANAAAARFKQVFNSTTDWTDVGEYHTVTVTAATHGKGLTPIWMTFETSGADNIVVEPDRAKFNASGDIEIRVTDADAEDGDTDCRFAGCLVII